MNENLIIIISWLTFSLIISVIYFVLLKKRKTNHQTSFPEDWNNYKKAIIKLDVSKINEFGQKVIWNEFLEPKHREQMFNDIKKLISSNPELKALWIDVHYKYKGVEPVD